MCYAERQVALPNEVVRFHATQLQYDSWCPRSSCLSIVNHTESMREITEITRVYMRSKKFELPEYKMITMLGSTSVVFHEVSSNFTYMVWNGSHVPYHSHNYIKSPDSHPSLQHWERDECGTTLHDPDVTVPYTFFPNNYGHVLHDWIPTILWMWQQYPQTTIVLPRTTILVNWITDIIPWLLPRVAFVHLHTKLCLHGMVRIPTWYHVHAQLHVNPISILAMHGLVTSPSPVKQDLVIFCSRNSSTVTHLRILQDEPLILDHIRSAMDTYGLSSNLTLRVYNGEMANGDRVSYRDQFDLFQRAHTIIGPHGSAMVNMLFTQASAHCSDPVKVLEFVPGMRSETFRLQSNNQQFRGYYTQLGYIPWVEYHEILWSDASTYAQTRILVEDLYAALRAMWSSSRYRGCH